MAALCLRTACFLDFRFQSVSRDAMHSTDELWPIVLTGLTQRLIVMRTIKEPSRYMSCTLLTKLDSLTLRTVRPTIKSRLYFIVNERYVAWHVYSQLHPALCSGFFVTGSDAFRVRQQAVYSVTAECLTHHFTLPITCQSPVLKPTSHRTLTMPFVGTKWKSETSAVTSNSPDPVSMIDEWSNSHLSKTAKRFSRSSAVPFMESSRSQKYRREELATNCPMGQKYYSCPLTGFEGCCSQNVCDLNVAPNVVCPPENKEPEIASSNDPSSESTSKSFATIASNEVSPVGDTTAGNLVSRSETPTMNSSLTLDTSAAAEAAMNMTMNKTALKAVEDITLAPTCPGGNGTRYTDIVNIAYTVRCGYDSTASSYNTVPMGTGGYAQCFSNCSASSDCGGFTFVGPDDGTCYFKTRMLRRQYVVKEGDNYTSCNKIDRLASVTDSSDTATETDTSTPAAEASSSKPNIGAIAGGVVGGIAIIALTLVLIAVLARRRRRKNLDTKRATVTHIFGGAIEPRRREQDDTTNAIPLHPRSGSTSHDFGPFAAFGGLSTQLPYSSVQAPEYQPQHARQRSPYRPPGETP
jgi:hypothetical protein